MAPTTTDTIENNLQEFLGEVEERLAGKLAELGITEYELEPVRTTWLPEYAIHVADTPTLTGIDNAFGTTIRFCGKVVTAERLAEIRANTTT